MNIKIMTRYKTSDLTSLLRLKNIINGKYLLCDIDRYSEWKEEDVDIPYDILKHLNIGEEFSIDGNPMVMTDIKNIAKTNKLGVICFEKTFYITKVSDGENKGKDTVLIHKSDIDYVSEVLRLEHRRVHNEMYVSNLAHETQETPFNVYKLIVISLSVIAVISLGIRFLFT